MTDATDLWAAVVVSYEVTGLVALTAIRDPSATTITTAVGVDAAQAAINLWPSYAQLAYDSANALHVEVAKRATIAVLWERGGTSATIAKVEWDEVFGADGLISKVRRTGPRGRQGPASSSGVTASSEIINGRRGRPWSDRDSLPIMGILPSRGGAD